jgi:type VII secretion-associated serine protease mycosin
MVVAIVSRRIRTVTVVAAGLVAAAGLWLPAVAAQAVTGQAVQYTPGANEWWLANWQVRQEVWPLTEGEGVTVAVVDTGVQASVPDLREAVLPGLDISGHHTNGETDFAEGVDGHGTAVAVMIAGRGLGTGTIGIAPSARILPVALPTAPLGVDVDGADLAQVLRSAVDHGAQVINMSFGGAVASASACDPTEQAAIAYALIRNVVIVAASGNANTGGPGPVDPASCAGVLAVGAVEPDGSLWPSSVRQPYVSVAAPGDHMVYVGDDGRYTTSGAGTSFSSPLVAGAAALIRSRYPTMPWYQVDQRLIDTAIRDGTPVPNDGYGYGIIDPARAVNASAYPVAEAAPDPVYAKFRAWLATPAGISFAQANGLPSGSAATAGPAASAGTGTGAAASPGPAGPGAGVSALEVLEAVGGVVGIGVLAVFGSRAQTRQRRAMVRTGLEYSRAGRARRGYRQQDWDVPQQGHQGPPDAPGRPPDPAPPGYPAAGYPPAGYAPPGYEPAGQPPTREQQGGARQSPYWWQQNENPPKPPPGWPG